MCRERAGKIERRQWRRKETGITHRGGRGSTQGGREGNRTSAAADVAGMLSQVAACLENEEARRGAVCGVFVAWVA